MSRRLSARLASAGRVLLPSGAVDGAVDSGAGHGEQLGELGGVAPSAVQLKLVVSCPNSCARVAY